MKTPDPAVPAELADGKNTDPGEGASSTPAVSAKPDNASSAPVTDGDVGPNASENASAMPPAVESDLRAGIVFAPYRW
jgi:hypothetical protein